LKFHVLHSSILGKKLRRMRWVVLQHGRKGRGMGTAYEVKIKSVLDATCETWAFWKDDVDWILRISARRHMLNSCVFG
jgi:hypothetical protein